MIAATLRRRLRSRLHQGEDEGFALIYVLMVSMVAMIAVTGMVVTTGNNLVPARTSQNRQAATAAAQAGIQDSLAYFAATPTSTCATTSTTADSVPCYTSTAARANVLAGSGETFSWSAKRLGNGTVRVTSTGSAAGSSTVLTADLRAGATATPAYGWYTKYETRGSNDITATAAARTVNEDCDGYRNKVKSPDGFSSGFNCGNGGQIKATFSGATNASTCDKAWYSSTALNGGTGAGRSSANSWTETGTANRTVSCDVPYTQGVTINGRAYSVDAPDLGTGSATGTGPSFGDVFGTGWSASASPSGITPYRTETGVSVTNIPVSATDPAPTYTSAIPTNSCIFYGPTRVYLNGDGTATVTSPQTSSSNSSETLSSDSSCYGTPLGNGQWRVNYGSAGNHVIAVRKLGTAATRATGQKSPFASSANSPAPATATAANTTFFVTGAATADTTDTATTGTAAGSDSGCSTTAYDPNSATPNQTCAWSEVHKTNGVQDGPGWTAHTVNMGCQAGMNRNANDQHNFNCEWNGNQTGGTTTNDTIYDTFRQRMQTRFQQGQCLTGVNAMVACVNTQLGEGSANQSDHRYLVTPVLLGQTPDNSTTRPLQNGGTSTATAPLANDPLFSSLPGGKATETKNVLVFRIDVDRQTLTNGAWGNSVRQFSFTVTMNAWLASFPGATSYFPNSFDITQYQTGANGANDPNSGPGDVYVEGVNSGPLALVSDGAAYVTGSITTAGNAKAAMVIDAMGTDGVKIYHPLVCALVGGTQTTQLALTNTSAGICPNDLTGLYTGDLQSNGTLKNEHPAMQYCSMTAGTPAKNNGNQNCNNPTIVSTATGDVTGTAEGVSQIDADLVAPAGSVSYSNYDRGLPMPDVTVNGGVFQKFHGPFSQYWGVQSTSNVRAYSGVKLTVNLVDMQSRVPFAPSFSAAQASSWSLISVSSGGS